MGRRRRPGRQSPREEGTGVPRSRSPRWRPHRRRTCWRPLLQTIGGPLRLRGAAGPSLYKRPTSQPSPTDCLPPWPGPQSTTGLTRWNGMADGASEAPTRPPGPQTGPGPDILTVPVDVGRRALVVANLGLKREATPATTWASSGLARVLDGWDGPGLVVVAGNLLDLTGESDTSSAASAALAAHPRLARALETFASSDDRRVICIPGSTDAALGSDAASALGGIGIEVAAAAALHMATAAGTRVVRVDAGVPSPVA